MSSVDFDALFEEHFDAIYGYLARRVGPDLARDLAAETFTRALGGTQALRPAPRRAARVAVRNRQQPVAAPLPRRGAPAAAFARVDVPREQAGSDEPPVAEALAVLSREERDVLLLFAWADLSYEQIAEALTLPIGTVRSRLNRARARMREELTREGALNG